MRPLKSDSGYTIECECAVRVEEEELRTWFYLVDVILLCLNERSKNVERSKLRYSRVGQIYIKLCTIVIDG